MGQLIAVTEKPTSKAGVIRFELNRSMTGMAHEHYAAGREVPGDRPVDELARRLLETGQIKSLHVYSNVVTVELDKGADGHGLAEKIEDLYIHYRPGVMPSVASPPKS